MAVRAAIGNAARATRSHVLRHRKKYAGGVGILVAAAIATLGAIAYVVNRYSVEKRFERAERNIAGGPRADVFREVLRHERLVRALALHGPLPAGLSKTERGIVDPVLRDALQQPTLAERLHLRTDPAHDPASLLVLLQRRNQELAGVLADRGGSIDEVDARLDVSRNVGPDPLLRPAAIVRAPFGSRDTARDAPERPEVADQLKALCLALGNSAIEFPDLCTDETLAATAPAN